MTLREGCQATERLSAEVFYEDKAAALDANLGRRFAPSEALPKIDYGRRSILAPDSVSTVGGAGGTAGIVVVVVSVSLIKIVAGPG